MAKKHSEFVMEAKRRGLTDAQRDALWAKYKPDLEAWHYVVCDLVWVVGCWGGTALKVGVNLAG